MRHRLRPRLFSSRKLRRGSTILLVIAILSMLALLAILLTFTSRIEMSSASNAAFGTQNRIASRTGTVPVSFALLANLPAGPTSSLNLALNEETLESVTGSKSTTTGYSKAYLENQTKEGSVVEPYSKPNPSITGNPDLVPLVQTSTAQVLILDVAGLVNINTADSLVLERFFTAANEQLGVKLSAKTLANQLIAVRYGADRAPGNAGVDDDFDAPEAIAPTQEDSTGLNVKSLNTNNGTSNMEYFDANSTSKRSEVKTALENSVDPLGNYYSGELESRQAERLAISTGVDEADEYIGDFRRVPYGDDVRFSSLEEMLTYPQLRSAGLNEDSLQVLSPYFTLFSATEDQFVADDQLQELVDLNRASAEELFAGFQRLYGTTKNETLLKQFAVNIVDSRDTDSNPTVYPGTSGRNAIVGLERTPVITEVYADARTPEEGGDDGQYVEIYNPWDQPLSLSGYRLRGAGAEVALNTTLPANGYLIVTDDANGQDDVNSGNDLAGCGSLYEIFGVIPNGGNRQILQNTTFALADKGRALTVELLDADSQVVDSFTYTGTEQDEDSLYSYQRESPIIRTTLRQQATPFTQLRTEQPSEEVIARLANSPLNGPFVNEADVLTIFTGFAAPALQSEGNDNQPNQSSGERQLWTFPVLGTPNSTDANTASLAKRSDLIDARVLDVVALFSRKVTPSNASNRTSNSKKANTATKRQESLRAFEQQIEKPEYDAAASSLLNEEEYETFALNEWIQSSPTISQTRINLNTAPAVVLESIPGISRSVAQSLVKKRVAQEEALREGKSGGSAHLFSRQSDLLIDDLLFPRELSYQQRLDLLRGILPRVAFNSRSFRVLSQPLADQAEVKDGEQAANRVQALVATDRKMPEILRLSAVNP